MADNVAITAGSGTSVATDDVSGVHYQRVKLVDGTLDSSTAIASGGGVEADALRVTIANDSTGVVSIDDNGASLTIDNAALATGSNSSLKTEGCTAHDGTDGGNPLGLGAGAVAHGTNPTAVAAGDRTRLYANRAGVLFTIGGHPNVATASVRIPSASGTQTDAAIAPGTIGTGTKIVVTRITVTCDNANTVNVACKIGFGASTLPADSTTGAAGVIIDHEGIPPGGGFTIGDGSGILAVGGDGEELRFTCGAPTAGHIIISYSYYTIES